MRPNPLSRALLLLGLSGLPGVLFAQTAGRSQCDLLANPTLLPEYFSPGRESFFKRLCEGTPERAPGITPKPVQPLPLAADEKPRPGQEGPALSITPNILVNTRGDTFPHITESETSIDSFDDDGDGLNEQVVMAWNGVVGATHGMGVGFSTDLGSTWTDLGLLANPPGFGNCCDPAVGVDSAGTFSIVVLTCNASVCQLGLSTFVPPGPPSVPTIIPGLIDVDREDMAVDNTGAAATEGNVYVCYTEFGGSGGIRLVRSTDGGATWSAPVTLGSGQACRVEVGAGGEVFATWHRTVGGVNDIADIHIRKCTPGVAECGVIGEWTADMVIDSVTRAQDPAAAAACGRPALNGNVRKTFENPTLAINRATGRVHIAYSFKASPGAADDANIRYQARNADLTAAIAPVQLNVDGTTTDQWRPFLAVTTGATPALAVAWYSRQLDAGNLNFDVFKRISMDDGVSFGTEERITTASSGVPPLIPNFDTDIANCYMSDYETMDADESSWYIGWSDNRLIANMTPDPDIRFSREILGDPPVALCKNVVKSADAFCEAIVTAAEVNNGSFDPDGGPLTLQLSPAGPFPLGNTAVTLTVTDDEGVTATCTATVTVVDLTPPVVAAHPDVGPIECTMPGGAVVNYAPPTAIDNCDLTPTVACVPPSGSVFPVGNTLVSCTATDDSGNVSLPSTFTVTVADTEPPVINSVAASPNVLWPPNHKMVPVTVTVSVTDECDPTPSCSIVSISSNEPVNGKGDGNTFPDWVITGPLTADLRAERAGPGTGRVYTLTVQCTDGSGNAASAPAFVSVPHNQ